MKIRDRVALLETILAAVLLCMCVYVFVRRYAGAPANDPPALEAPR